MTDTEKLQIFLARSGLYSRAVDDVHGPKTERAQREALARHLAKDDTAWSEETWDDDDEDVAVEEAERRDQVRQRRFAALGRARAAVSAMGDEAVRAEVLTLVLAMDK